MVSATRPATFVRAALTQLHSSAFDIRRSKAAATLPPAATTIIAAATTAITPPSLYRSTRSRIRRQLLRSRCAHLEAVVDARDVSGVLEGNADHNDGQRLRQRAAGEERRA